MGKREKNYNLAVRLLKVDKSIKDILDDDFEELVINEPNIKGYLLKSEPKPVWWKSYLKIDKNIFNKSNSFILFITVQNRIFAYTFGFAHSKLKADDIVENFGFMVTINSLDGDKLKSINTYSPSNNTKQRKIVSSVLTNIYEYGFNDQLDLVQKISGIVKNEYSLLFKNPTGMDGLKISSKKSRDELIELSKSLLERYNSEDYLKDDNLKNINRIKKASSDMSSKLDNMLLEDIKNKAGNVFLTDFEIIEYDELYKYKFGETTLKDFDFQEIRGLLEIDDIEKLKREIIHILKSEDDTSYKSWKLYKCLVCDFKLEGKSYFLSKGIWYEIDEDFLSEVNDVENYLIKDHELPKFSGTIEAKYNESVVKSNPNKYFLFDKKNVNIVGRGTMEICDIYDKDKNIFYHIKQGNNSSNLSHLWEQGLVSEQIANTENKKYIAKFKHICGFDLKEDRKIYYGIVSNPNLPIFSKISLYNTLNLFKQIKKGKDNVGYFFIERDKNEKN